MGEQLYCGCCGNETGPSMRSDPDWCIHCRSHVLPHRDKITGNWTPPWERTWFAQTATDCPYHVPNLPADRRS
jgi:hypothetical protein